MSKIVTNTIETSTGGAVTLTKSHASKAWCNAGLTGNLFDSFNVSSADDDGPGAIGINFTNNFDNATYVPTSSTSYTTDTSTYRQYLASNFNSNLDETRTTATCHFGNWESGLVDPGSWAMSFIGDLS